MALISFVLLSLCPFLAPATQDCQGNDCPVTVNSLLQVKDKTRTQSEDDVTSAQATTYAEGTDGTNSCLAGYSKIDSESDCIAAAGELSIPWKGELPAGQQSSSPGGCLRNANNHAYYNPTSGGDREENAPICKEPPTTTTTTTTIQACDGVVGSIVYLDGTNAVEYLNILELTVNNGDVSLTATLSSEGGSAPAWKCVDGDLSTMCHTSEAKGWWAQFDTGAEVCIESVWIKNRGDHQGRIVGTVVSIRSSNDSPDLWSTTIDSTADTYEFAPEAATLARDVQEGLCAVESGGPKQGCYVWVDAQSSSSCWDTCDATNVCVSATWYTVSPFCALYTSDCAGVSQLGRSLTFADCPSGRGEQGWQCYIPATACTEA